MMRLRFLGFPVGSAVDLTLAQNGLAVRADKPSWGVASDGGTIAIVPERSDLQVAPDSVGFRVDLSGASFETPAPATADLYDPRFHGLYYFWDFDDPDEYTAPENVLPEWKARGIGYGPFARHMYRKPGSYTVRVTVIEPATGRTAAASLRVNVDDPATAFPGAQTIVVSDDPGEFTWAGAPAGAQRFTDPSAALAAYEAFDLPGRLLFKRGGSFSEYVLVRSHKVPVCFGTWGSGPKPVLNQPATGTTQRCFDFHNQWKIGKRADARIMDLDMRGKWDPLTGSGEPGAAIWSLAPLHLMVTGCEIAGFAGAVTQQQGSDHGSYRVHVDDTVITDYWSYPVFTSKEEPSKLAYTGLRAAQHADAPQWWTGMGNAGGPIRVEQSSEVYIHGCDLFHNTGHEATNPNPTWPCLKWNDANENDGNRLNMHCCALEGGLAVIRIGGNPGSDPARRINALIESCVLLGDHETQFMIDNRSGGLTVRNCLLIQPAMPFNRNRLDDFVQHAAFPVTGTTAGESPNKVYSNTMVFLRAEADNANDIPVGVEDNLGSTGSVLDNNVLHLPNLITPRTPFAPLAVSGPLWGPRNTGYRPGDTRILDTSFRPAADVVATYSPEPGSPALGTAASGEVALTDFYGRLRPDFPSKGAFEKAG